MDWSVLFLVMILPAVRELIELSRLPKLDGTNKVRAYSLMRELRANGFKNHELFVLVRGKVSEISIKRHTGGVEVRDTKEHDKVIELLADFAARGFELVDVEDYKEDKALVGAAGLTFEKCATLSTNLFKLRVDAAGLIELSKELSREELTAKSIRENIDLNKSLSERGITPAAQVKILEAVGKFGSEEEILKMVFAWGDLMGVLMEYERVKKELEKAVLEKDRAEVERRRLESDSLAYKGYFDVVKLLVTDYSYSLDSLKNLHELAEKYGNPLRVMGALNAYTSLEQIRNEVLVEDTRLQTLREQLRAKEAKLSQVTRLVEEAERKLGEIRANHAHSFRLQMVSDLIQNPKRIQATPEELAKLLLTILNGVLDNNSIYPGGAAFDGIVRTNMAATAMRLEVFLRDTSLVRR